MANIKSQMKRNRQNDKLRMRNKAVRSEMKTRVKQTLQAIEDPSADATEAFQLAQKRIDEAVSKGVMHKNTASRKKARLARRVNAQS
jgi:small subunit ribosomal protein S20